MGRRRFVGLGATAIAGLGLSGCERQGTGASRRAPLPEAPVCFPERRPNVLFLSIDDLNDFASPYGGYPGAVTPNLERLAARGVTFDCAYCSVPMCGGSRSATMSGVAPFRSGLHRQENILDVEDQVLSRIGRSGLESIPRWFRGQGYRVLGGGKIFHAGFGAGEDSPGDYDQDVWEAYRHFDWSAVDPNYRIVDGDGRLPAMIGRAYDDPAEERNTPDRDLARWTADRLRALASEAASGAPFFLAAGFYRPHISWFVPSRYYDLYPLDSIRVPDFFAEEDDLLDLPPFAKRHLVEIERMAQTRDFPDSKTDHYQLGRMPVRQGRRGQAQAIQAYLASMSYSDDCLGDVLDALEETGLAESTIVVLWSDHGWFLGEKLGWRKFKMWEPSARVPLIVSAPGGPEGARTDAVASLLDLFPTLVDLVGDGELAGPPQGLDGRSLRPVIEDPDADFPSAAITSKAVRSAGGALIYTLRTSRYRYIMYPPDSGALSEELYDLESDPDERTNLLYASWNEHATVRRTLRKMLMTRIGMEPDVP